MSLAPDPTRLVDGFASLEGGMNSGRAASLIDPNQARMAVNYTFRGGYPRTRPPFVWLDMEDTGAWRSGGEKFHGAHVYYDPSGVIPSKIILGVQGQIVALDPLTLKGEVLDTGLSDSKMYFCQAEKYLIIQNGSDYPRIYDGTAIQRSIDFDPNYPIPVGTIMAYGQGRLFVVDRDRRFIAAGDLVFGGSAIRRYISNATAATDSVITTEGDHSLGEGDVVTIEGLISTPTIDGTYLVTEVLNATQFKIGIELTSAGAGGFAVKVVHGQDSDLLRFSETTYLAEGYAFQFPLNMGRVTGMIFPSLEDTSTGHGDLIVSGDYGMCSFAVSLPRIQWKTSPFQKVVFREIGATSPTSFVSVNGDFFFNSFGGIRNYRNSHLAFYAHGLPPLSGELNSIFKLQRAIRLLEDVSAVEFDNRFLMTVLPDKTVRSGQLFYQGLVALDFNAISLNFGKTTTAYDGLWTGPDILQILKGRFDGQDRCYILALGQPGPPKAETIFDAVYEYGPFVLAITSETALFSPSDVGIEVQGPHLPAGTRIELFISPTKVKLTNTTIDFFVVDGPQQIDFIDRIIFPTELCLWELLPEGSNDVVLQTDIVEGHFRPEAITDANLNGDFLLSDTALFDKTGGTAGDIGQLVVGAGLPEAGLTKPASVTDADIDGFLLTSPTAHFDKKDIGQVVEGVALSTPTKPDVVEHAAITPLTPAPTGSIYADDVLFDSDDIGQAAELTRPDEITDAFISGNELTSVQGNFIDAEGIVTDVGQTVFLAQPDEVTDAAVNSNILTSATAKFQLGDIGQLVTGAGLPSAEPLPTEVTDAGIIDTILTSETALFESTDVGQPVELVQPDTVTDATLDNSSNISSSSALFRDSDVGQAVELVRPTVITDGATISGVGSFPLTSNTAMFDPSDVGATVSGGVIVGSGTISAYVSPTHVTVSGDAIATSSGQTLTFVGRVNVSLGTIASVDNINDATVTGSTTAGTGKTLSFPGRTTSPIGTIAVVESPTVVALSDSFGTTVSGVTVDFPGRTGTAGARITGVGNETTVSLSLPAPTPLTGQTVDFPGRVDRPVGEISSVISTNHVVLSVFLDEDVSNATVHLPGRTNYPLGTITGILTTNEAFLSDVGSLNIFGQRVSFPGRSGAVPVVIASYFSPTQAVLSAFSSPASGQTVTFPGRTGVTEGTHIAAVISPLEAHLDYPAPGPTTVNDAIITLGDLTKLTSATANFSALDVGSVLAGALITPGTTIVSVESPTELTMSVAQAGAAPNVTITIVFRQQIAFPDRLTLGPVTTLNTSRILSHLETRAFNFNKPLDLKQLIRGALWFADVRGQVDVSVFFRADQNPLWTPWGNFTLQADTCLPMDFSADAPPGNPCSFKEATAGYFPDVVLPTPPETCDPNTNRIISQGHEFEVRVSVEGCARLVKMILHAIDKPELVGGDCPGVLSTERIIDCSNTLLDYTIGFPEHPEV